MALSLLVILYGAVVCSARISPWHTLKKGLFFASFKGTTSASHSPYSISVLKIDPHFYRLVLLMCAREGTGPLTLKQWVERYHLVAAINASMFWKDYTTSTGYMRGEGYVNQSLIHKHFGGFFVFAPLKKSLPFATIIEKGEPGWKRLLSQYDCVVQSFRMISKNRKNLWKKSDRTYSVSAIGIDNLHKILFIFSLKPISMHELNDILLSLPLNIAGCIFTEGGKTAGMYIKIHGFEKSIVGYSSFNLLEREIMSHRVPNVIGVISKNIKKLKNRR